LVDRCLSIRKDIRELEVLEVKAGTDSFDIAFSKSSFSTSGFSFGRQGCTKGTTTSKTVSCSAACDRDRIVLSAHTAN
jgi:hypothetical protein